MAEGVFQRGDSISELAVQMERCRKLIIGALSGFAVTGRFELALACHLLVATRLPSCIHTHAVMLHWFSNMVVISYIDHFMHLSVASIWALIL